MFAPSFPVPISVCARRLTVVPRRLAWRIAPVLLKRSIAWPSTVTSMMSPLLVKVVVLSGLLFWLTNNLSASLVLATVKGVAGPSFARDTSNMSSTSVMRVPVAEVIASPTRRVRSPPSNVL